MLAKCVVLLPGAAQASMTWLPAIGDSRYAGRHEACEEKVEYFCNLLQLCTYSILYCTKQCVRLSELEIRMYD